MADLVYVLLTLVFFGVCAVIAGVVDRRSGLRAECQPVAARSEPSAGGEG